MVRLATTGAAAGAEDGWIRALAAVVDNPVAAANADRGPAKGISGEPLLVMGFAIEMISGMSVSTN